MSKLQFGVLLPQYDASWSQVQEVAHAAEEAGFDSVWAVDHLIGFPADTGGILEGWTLLTAVAATTRRVRIGHQVICLSFRSPALLAKMAATLDVISGGRLIVGLGAGWNEPEYVQYGYDFPPIPVRLAQLGETLEVLRGLWTRERTTFAGKHYTLRDAACEPKPVQSPLPIMIGGGGERVLLRHVARHADIWNNLGIYHAEVGHKREVLARHCKAIGRNPAEITISQQCLAAVATDRATAARRTEAVFAELGFLDGAPELALTGTPDEVRARVEKNRALGVSAFTLSFGRRTAPEDLGLFGREVVAAFR